MVTRSIFYFCLFLICSLAPTRLNAEDRREVVHFESGKNQATFKGTLLGYGYVDYVLSAKSGQELIVTFKPTNLSANFTLFSPGGENVEFDGPKEGETYTSKLTSSGEYVVRVLLMRNAARRNEKSDYTIILQLE